MSPDSWQFIIGVLAILDAAYLVYKLKQTKDKGIIAAILPRAYVGVWYLLDAFVQRTTMEPARTISFVGVALLFFTANFNHYVEWRHRK